MQGVIAANYYFPLWPLLVSASGPAGDGVRRAWGSSGRGIRGLLVPGGALGGAEGKGQIRGQGDAAASAEIWFCWRGARLGEGSAWAWVALTFPVSFLLRQRAGAMWLQQKWEKRKKRAETRNESMLPAPRGSSPDVCCQRRKQSAAGIWGDGLSQHLVVQHRGGTRGEGVCWHGPELGDLIRTRRNPETVQSWLWVTGCGSPNDSTARRALPGAAPMLWDGPSNAPNNNFLIWAGCWVKSSRHSPPGSGYLPRQRCTLGAAWPYTFFLRHND